MRESSLTHESPQDNPMPRHAVSPPTASRRQPLDACSFRLLPMLGTTPPHVACSVRSGCCSPASSSARAIASSKASDATSCSASACRATSSVRRATNSVGWFPPHSPHTPSHTGISAAHVRHGTRRLAPHEGLRQNFFVRSLVIEPQALHCPSCSRPLIAPEAGGAD